MASTATETAAAGAPITVTKNEKMLRIMRHEYRDAHGKFDPKQATDYLGTLSPQQVKLLQSYPKQKYANKHRLVIFITLDPSINLPMCADKCDTAATLINSNSHFAVFHCDGEAQLISLVCYTNEFNLFLHRPPLDIRTAESPKVYKISAMNMSYVPSGEGDTLWNRVSKVGPNDVGIAIYGGDAKHAPNSLHGMINTQGCWMLFRNYNWYKPRQPDFLEVYRGFRQNGMTPQLRARLRSLGYLEQDDTALDQRFLAYERNYAYTWFTRDIIGVEYFSTNYSVNDTNVDGSLLLPTFPSPSAPSGYNSHSWGSRHAIDGAFSMEASLWTTNALGFKTSEAFAPFVGKETYHLESRSWADLYVYGQ